MVNHTGSIAVEAVLGVVIGILVIIVATVAYGIGKGASIPDTVPACVMEDDIGPCWWDADAAGNGTGVSFLVDGSGRIHYLAPRTTTGENG